jgi:hypothetical protein
VLGNTDGVGLAVADLLHQRHPHPTHPPQGGGEKGISQWPA